MEDMLSLRFQNSVSSGNEIQVVAFQLGKEEYAVDILNVQEINRLLNITRVPRAEKHIDGVINLRGNIIPVINLHKKFNLQSSGNEEDKRIIVFEFEDVKAGIIVDEVSEVLRLNTADIEATDRVYNSINADHIKGIAKVQERLLILLDLQKILDL
ncbi:chemotaxis protein CheW [Syntrophomonas palmitatica]|uniref:chemotaxis protein CheW n=1 Tax=Syntrophomonas palmitatica TaxID=402877 RepID=UPI0006D015BC|nr:chemotaxis protein CheW [Syntrophomonas palmitatica]